MLQLLLMELISDLCISMENRLKTPTMLKFIGMSNILYVFLMQYLKIFFHSAHYFCLLFAPGLEQGGTDEEGIKGFLPNDILKEWRRGSRLKCQYCEKKYGKTYHIYFKCIIVLFQFHPLILIFI